MIIIMKHVFIVWDWSRNTIFVDKLEIFNEVCVLCWPVDWQLKPSLKLLDCGSKIQNDVHIDTDYCKPDSYHDDKST